MSACSFCSYEYQYTSCMATHILFLIQIIINGNKTKMLCNPPQITKLCSPETQHSIPLNPPKSLCRSSREQLQQAPSTDTVQEPVQEWRWWVSMWWRMLASSRRSVSGTACACGCKGSLLGCSDSYSGAGTEGVTENTSTDPVTRLHHRNVRTPTLTESLFPGDPTLCQPGFKSNHDKHHFLPERGNSLRSTNYSRLLLERLKAIKK